MFDINLANFSIKNFWFLLKLPNFASNNKTALNA